MHHGRGADEQGPNRRLDETRQTGNHGRMRDACWPSSRVTLEGCEAETCTFLGPFAEFFRLPQSNQPDSQGVANN